MACVAVTSLVRTLELEFLQPQPRPIVLENEFISGNKELIESLREKLEFLMEQFDEKRMDGVEAIKHLETKLKDVAFKVEDEIEFQIVDLYVEKTRPLLRFRQFFYRAIGKPHPCLSLHHILQQAIEDIDHIKAELLKVNKEYEHVIDLQGRNTALDVLPKCDEVIMIGDSSKHVSLFEDIMVGKDDEFKTIKELLIEHPSKQREVISIKGMGGIGKTTLARRVYEDPSIASHFDKRAWVVASQLHNKRKMLVGLNSIFQLQNAESCRKLAAKLCECLKDQSLQLKNAESYTELAENLYESLGAQRSQLTNTESCLQLAEQLYECLKGQSLQLNAESNKQLVEKLDQYLKELEDVEIYTNDRLAETLYQFLKGQRYMIVMDDVWSEGAWKDVQSSFPDDKNGSRVMLTTRLEDVADHTASGNDFSHQMHLLNQSESWNLFCEKVLLKGRSHSAQFGRIARPIVERCRGLPLAIVVAAGLFSKLNTLDEWKNIAKTLNSSATTIAEACSRILSLSYNHLRHTLKACFLYLGVFPEDEEIYANNLARLWAAEGLVKATENESFEVVAQRHIQELRDRNLILVSKQSSSGRKIKTFWIHDVLHAFCVGEAQNENLLKVVGKNGSNFHQKYFRWVSIQSSNLDVPTLYSSSKNCRSILYFLKSVVPFLNLQNFNILRVLYAPDVKDHEQLIFCKILCPVHLRYLFSPKARILNSKPFSPWNLQTLCAGRKAKFDRDGTFVNNFFGYSLDFPQLWYCNYDRDFWPFRPKFVHQNLQSISTLSMFCCTKKLFTNIPHLKKACIAKDMESSVDCIGCIGNLAYLQQLESLKIYAYSGEFEYPINNQIALLQNIKKLSFFGTAFLWEEINVLSTLPRLEVLKLGRLACKGENWELREEAKFCQLIFLNLHHVDLEHWEVSGDHFPKLERLLLNKCYNLKEIPGSFADISTLKSIELERCLPSAVTSAKQIQEEQRDYGNDNMVVIQLGSSAQGAEEES